MSSKLRLKANLVTYKTNAIQNLKRVLENSMFSTMGVMIESISSSVSLLSEEQMNLGVVVADIGGGTTDLIVLKNGTIKGIAEIPMGGILIRQKIQQLFKVTEKEAEWLKVNYGVCDPHLLCDPDEVIRIERTHTMQPKIILRRELCSLIQNITAQILMFCKTAIEQYIDWEDLYECGIIITGGTSKMAGIVELARDCMGLNVRVA